MSMIENEPVEEVVDETDELLQQHALLKDLLSRSSDESARYKQRVEQLGVALQEKDKRIHDLQQFEYRVKKTDDRILELEKKLEEEKHHTQKYLEEKIQAESKLNDVQQHVIQLERVIQFLRERAETAQLETRQLQADQQNAQASIKSISQQLEASKADTEQLRSQYHKEKNKCEDLTLELQAIQSQWGQLQQTVRTTQQQMANVEQTSTSLTKEIDQLQNTIQTKEKAHADLIKKLGETEQELASKQVKLNQAELQFDAFIADNKVVLEEKDANVRLAQQHLAKRVREATLLAEKVDEQQASLQEFQQAFAEAQKTAYQLHSKIDAQEAQQKNLSDELAEQKNLVVSTQKHWEEKYFIVSDKLNKAELQVKELKALENKHVQLKTLMENFNAVMHTNIETSVIEAPVSTENPTMHQEPIFEMSKPGIRYKQTLFD